MDNEISSSISFFFLFFWANFEEKKSYLQILHIKYFPQRKNKIIIKISLTLT